MFRARGADGRYVTGMDEYLRGYREPAPPKPERFPVQMSGAARVSLLISVGAIVLSVVLLLTTGHFFLFFIAALGPGLFYLLSGAPRVVEVHHDAAVVRWWLRAPVRLPVPELSVRRDDFQLVLDTGEARVAIGADHFAAGSLDRCVDALRAKGARVQDRRA